MDSIAFDPQKLYFSTLNREAVQGSILSRHGATPEGWYEVVSLTPLVLNVPELGAVTIPAGADPSYTIKAARIAQAKAQGTYTPKRRAARNGQPSKRVNYAELVVKR